MEYIILDLEWNQSFQGKDFENKDLPFEIIEMGAVKLDEQLNICSEFSQIIKPQIYKKIHFKIKELTSLKETDLEEGRDFTDVIKDFISWCGTDYIFCTWGPSDLTELQRNMKFYQMEKPFVFPLIYYDIQKLFSIYYEDRKVRRSLEYVVDFLNIELSDSFHRAFSDAHYTAQVLKTMNFELLLRDYSIDTFYKPETKNDEILAVFDTYSKYISRLFESKEKALQDREVVSTRCYLCEKPAKKKIRWFSDNAKIYYSLSYCEEHGYLKGKLRMKKDGDNFYVVKTLKLAGEEGAELIRKKQKEIRLKRKNKRHAHE